MKTTLRALTGLGLLAGLTLSTNASAQARTEIAHALGSITTATSARSALSARFVDASTATLVPTPVMQTADGRSVYRFQQRHAGIPVMGRGASVVSGSRSFAAVSLVRDFPSDTTPLVSAAQAASKVSGFTAKDARLVWLPTGSTARLVWGLYRGNVANLPSAPVVMVDARTGKVAMMYDAVVFDREATVHAQNPVTTPQTEMVQLVDLPQGATTLTGPRITVQNCIDKHTLSGGQFSIHACEMEQHAVANAQGDFPYTYTGDTLKEDEYAEVSMFYHLTVVYDFFEQLGMPQLDAVPIPAIVNLRMPAGYSSGNYKKMKDTTLDLEPYDNAFFTPENPFGGGFGPDGQGLWFGQGTFADFSYDGDVVYHEFGHAMANRTIDFVSHWHLDQWGSSVSPGAMNEGLADYFSSAITGDPNVGEYAAKNVSAGYGGVIRTLDNKATCPESLTGEVHEDSNFFSGGLWSVRKSLPETDRNTFDAAVLAALMAAPSGDVGYDDLGELIASSVDSSPLGTTVGKALRDELQSRGVLPTTKRVLEYEGKPINANSYVVGNAFMAPGRFAAPVAPSADYVPGLIQIHDTLEEGAKTLKVVWAHQERQQNIYGGQGDPYDPALLVRFDADPIQFSYSPSPVSNAGDPVEVEKLADTYRAEIPIPEGATDVYVMIVNRGDRDAMYRAVSLDAPAPKPPPIGTGGFGGSGGLGGAAGSGGAQATTDEDLAPAGGCACSAPAAPHGRLRRAVGGRARAGVALASTS